jgi:hypothetical protein
MGAFVVYVLEWSACLLLFLILYKMCFSGTTFHRFNRLYLLGTTLLSAVLPSGAYRPITADGADGRVVQNLSVGG